MANDIEAIARFQTALHPAPLPLVGEGEEQPEPSAEILDMCEVYAHQSGQADNALNVEIDAPDGATVFVHINDWQVCDVVIGEPVPELATVYQRIKGLCRDLRADGGEPLTSAEIADLIEAALNG